MIEVRCDNCRYWVAHQDDLHGHCRFNPPVPIRLSDKEDDRIAGKMNVVVDGFWPVTAADKWCGQHAPEIPDGPPATAKSYEPEQAPPMKGKPKAKDNVPAFGTEYRPPKAAKDDG